jgi:hypothetical protein
VSVKLWSLHEILSVSLDRKGRKSLEANSTGPPGDLGNVEAGVKGPTSHGKRVVRRQVLRKSNGLTRRFLKGFGL